MGRLFPSEMRTPRASANLCLLVDNQFQCVNRLTPAVVAAVQPVGKGLHGRWRGAQRQGTLHARCQIQAARRLAVHPATACTRGRSAHYIGMLWEGHGVATSTPRQTWLPFRMEFWSGDPWPNFNACLLIPADLSFMGSMYWTLASSSYGSWSKCPCGCVIAPLKNKG